MDTRAVRTYNCGEIDIKDIPVLSVSDLSETAFRGTREDARISSFWGSNDGSGNTVLTMVLARDKDGYLEVMSTSVKGSYPSLSGNIPQAHLFEREIYEQCGVRPEGHPCLKPVRRPASAGDFLSISGEEIHEVAVGPVHAGIIEPGHFRFQCHGEQVFHLDIALGYQHRGLEKMLPGGPDKRTIHYIETAAGDTTIGHTLAYCQAMESLSGREVPLRASVLRAIMLELERLANHTGDLGAMAGDIGYLPTSSYCGRLRGEFLNMTALICGNRFGRNMVRPGGVTRDMDAAMIKELRERLSRTFSDVKNAVSLLWSSSLVVDRFDETGIISERTASGLGLVGVAARACGIERDVRFDMPVGAFRFSHIPISTHSTGDVFARAFVRWLEIQRSVEFIFDQLDNLPNDGIFSPLPEIRPGKMVVSLVEGWRGEICHSVLTGANGKIAGYKIVDPSFHNWPGLAMALRGEEISNFPLCNKSFDLSYCGHDL
ncbi:MAG: NADH-quinone oxidoreductase subunit C [Candidatus Omnitrophica bacterium]|nr:NADH-quinone oxidoreductase subunit C [Candidatus Omnitrophota bacterium]